MGTMNSAAHIQKRTVENGYLGAGIKTGAAIVRRHYWDLYAADGRMLETFPSRTKAERALRLLPAEFK